jgi:hypothetical protein
VIGENAKKMGEALVAAKILSANQLSRAIQVADKENSSLIIALLELGYLTFKVFEKFLRAHTGIKSAIVSEYKLEEGLIEKLSFGIIQQRMVIPIVMREEGNSRTLALGMVDPLDKNTINDVEKRMYCKVVPVLISIPDFKSAVEKFSPDSKVDIVQEKAGKEPFVVIRQGGFEEEIANHPWAKDSGINTNTNTVQPKPGWEAASQVDFFGTNKKIFREEIFLKLEVEPAEIPMFSSESYTRESLALQLKSLNTATLQKSYKKSSRETKIEGLANALIKAGVLTKNDILVWTAVSHSFSGEKS